MSNDDGSVAGTVDSTVDRAVDGAGERVPEWVADAGGAQNRGRLAIVLVAVAALLIGGLMVLLLSGDPNGAESASTPLLNQPAPDAAGRLADGTTFQLGRRKGSWVVLNFFTENCVPCVREQPVLVDFVAQQRSLGLDGAEFYSIVQHSTPAEVDAFFELRGGGDWPVVYDDEYEFQTGFGVAQVPETWVIDPDGFVRARIIGEVSSADALSSLIQRMREARG